MRRFLATPFLAISMAFFWVFCTIAGVDGFMGEYKDNDEEHP